VRLVGWIAEPGVSSQPYHLSSLSADEQLTLLSYWTMWRAPLMFGGDLLKPDPFSLALITNAAALQITDHSVNNAPVNVSAQLILWRADSDDWQRDGVSFVSIHNLQNTTAVIDITVALSRQPTQAGDVCLVQDVWTGEMLGSRRQLSVNLRRHASVIYRLYDCNDSAGVARE
jgi:alpha-galactosidase